MKKIMDRADRERELKAALADVGEVPRLLLDKDGAPLAVVVPSSSSVFRKALSLLNPATRRAVSPVEARAIEQVRDFVRDEYFLTLGKARVAVREDLDAVHKLFLAWSEGNERTPLDLETFARGLRAAGLATAGGKVSGIIHKTELPRELHSDSV